MKNGGRLLVTSLRDAPNAGLLLTLKCKHQLRNYQREKEKSAVASVVGDTPALSALPPTDCQRYLWHAIVYLYAANTQAVNANFRAIEEGKIGGRLGGR
ncbi:hypothetical protein [Tolypothrix sp. VBCCA 56010]|uniref:hypothetical protein n=1 Tax=Tolypothrix sp. VBCCA 56010 TaxID=3137731 RepID=UPI003D7EFE76